MVLSMEDAVCQQINGQAPSKVAFLELNDVKSDEIKGITADYVSLTTLILTETGVKSLKGLPKLPKLKTLDVAECQLEGDLDRLVDCCPAIERLILSKNPIKDLTKLEPLVKLEHLKVLELLGTDIAKTEDYKVKVFEMLPKLVALDGQTRTGEDYEDEDIDDDEDEDDDDDEDSDQEGGPGLSDLVGGDIDDDDDEEDFSEDEGEEDDEDDDEDDEDDDDEGDTPQKKDTSSAPQSGTKRKQREDDDDNE